MQTSPVSVIFKHLASTILVICAPNTITQKQPTVDKLTEQTKTASKSTLREPASFASDRL